MQYHKEIDGLRAIAVLSVIFFHSDFHIFSGGYVGVDIFFVISGYLISTIIINEYKNQEFKLSKFYERRIRRIIPALAIVTMASMPFAYYILTPEELRKFSQSLIALSVFSSNIFFWKTTGYFDDASELQPLLHTWSLTTEEQFYLLFPIFFIFIMKNFYRYKLHTIFFIALASFIYSDHLTITDASSSFYLLPTRAWELISGVVLSIILKNNKYQHLDGASSKLFSTIGFIFLLYSITNFDKNTPTPSYYTLIPILGTCLLIAYSNKSNIAGKILGNNFITGIGTLSYSAYLWHQPIFSFYRLSISGQPEKLEFIILIFITMLLAYLTQKFIEVPFRKKNLVNQKTILLVWIIFSLTILITGIIGNATKGFLKLKMSKNQQLQLETAKSSPMREKCHTGKSDYIKPANACEYFQGDRTIAVFGDSHTVELAYALAKDLKSLNFKVKHFSFSGCIPSFGFPQEKDFYSCSEWTNESIKYISESKKIEHVIVSYRIHAALFGDHAETYPILPQKIDKNEREKRLASYINTLKYFSTHGKKVFLVLQAPELPKSIEKLIGNSPNEEKNIHGVTRKWWNERTNFLIKNLNKIPSSIIIINPADHFCDLSHCYAVKNNVSYYFDDDHISIYGAQILSKEIIDILN